MEEQHQHGNGGHGSAVVYDSTVQSDARGGDGKDRRQDGDQGRVGTFDAEAGDLGKNAEARGRKGWADDIEPRQHSHPSRADAFDAKAEVAVGGYVDAWQRQVAGFYGMRLRKNVEFGRRFVEVKRIADLLGLQHEYVSDMLFDYTSGFWSLCGFGLRAPQHTAERSNR